jgi:2,4-diketo-3-deoxy-L-fuconate hydrolase
VKLVRYGARGHERPGIIDNNGAIRDISALTEDIGPRELSAGIIARLREAAVNQLPIVAGTPRLGAPLNYTGKFLAIGLNYRDHAAEAKMPIPIEPVLFMKAPSCLNGPFDPVIKPRDSSKLDWEVELGVVIGAKASYVTAERAFDHVAGYLAVHDVSERAFQLERGGQWDKGKGCDTFGPIGPWLVTADEIPDPQALNLWLDVNGVRKQRGNTNLMIFPVSNLVSYLSQFMTLEPGDIITTGTPPGVGMGRTPPEYLAVGDIVTLGIDRLGEQRQEIVAY